VDRLSCHLDRSSVPFKCAQVLFVLSADRPLTESEVRFLQYVRQWGKKVVFVVNKVSL